MPFGHEVDQGEKSVDLTSAPGQTKETDDFMKTLFANMANDPDSRIVLNGCLTASQQVPGPLDPDPDKAAKQVAAAVKAQPSLVNYLRDSAKTAGSNAKVMGANASFDQVALQDASGNLDIVAKGGSDPQLTASKLDYIRAGTEPLGVLRAVLEVWARTARTPPTRTAADTVHNRVTTEAASKKWNPLVIQTLLKVVDGAIDNAEQTRLLAGAADVLGGDQRGLVLGVQADLRGSARSHVDDLHRHEGCHRLRGLRRDIDDPPGLDAGGPCQGGRFHDGPRSRSARRRHELRRHRRDQRQVGGVAAHRRRTARLEGTAEVGAAGRHSGGVDPQAKAFLRAVAGPHPNFDPALGIDGLLDHTATVDRVEVAIGLHGDKVDPGLGGSKPPPAPNVDVDRNAINDLHVESMTATGTVTARRLNVREQPSLSAAIVAGLSSGDSVDIMGSTKYWYAIRLGGRTRFVFRTFVDV